MQLNYVLFNNFTQFEHPPFFLQWGIDLTKNSKKDGDGKIAEGQGDPKKGGFCRKGGDAVSLGIFSSQGMANVTTVTFN